jgi:membrane protein YqaA with SNARE-associated domain
MTTYEERRRFGCSVIAFALLGGFLGFFVLGVDAISALGLILRTLLGTVLGGVVGVFLGPRLFAVLASLMP